MIIIGHISNPSPLYEVEMINENGTIFLITNIVDFAPKIERDISKNCKRFIYIAPTVIQSLINQQKSGFNKENIKSANQVKNDVVLSLASQKIWGKKFKIRIKSKQSNKVLDILLKFVHNKIEFERKE